MSMRYVVVGAGGIGSGIAGFLDLAGVESMMVTRAEHAAAVNRSGLTLLDGDGNRSAAFPNAVTAVADVDWSTVDLALLTVKSYDTVSVAESLFRLARAVPPVVCVQNGIDNESTLARFGLEAIGAVARFKARLIEPGKVLLPGERSITVGRPPNTDHASLVRHLCKDLHKAGITSSFSDEIMPEKWSKLVANCANIIYAVTETEVRAIRTDPYLARCINMVWAEARGILGEVGVEFTPIPDLEVPGAADALGVEPSPVAAYHGSTWDDMRRGKPRNEVPWFNGKVVSLAYERGLDAPLNRYLLGLAACMAGDTHQGYLMTTRTLEDRLLQLVE